jgi:predicted transcriptional regulator
LAQPQKRLGFFLIYDIRNQSSSFIVRTTINLDNAQVNRLDVWAKAEKVSRAEAVRRAVNQMLERATAPQGTGFGLWAQNRALGVSLPLERDGLVLQRAMRDEWPD